MIDRRLFAFAAVALLLACAAPAGAGGAVGSQAHDFTLTSASGEQLSLAGLEGKTVVLEWINPNCPFSARHAKEKTMATLAAKYADSDVVWLAVNSTSRDSRDFLEPAEHLAWNRDHGIDYAVLYDESGEVGHAFDAKTTPHMFIIDGSGRIVYNGAIDDDPSGRTASAERTNYVGGGLTALAAAAQPDPASTRPYGCSVKY